MHCIRKHLKALALLLVIVLLIGIMPTATAVAHQVPDEGRAANNDASATKTDRFADGVVLQYSIMDEYNTDRNSAMTFTRASLRGKNTAVAPKTNESMILDRAKPETGQGNGKQGSFAQSVVLLLDQFDTQKIFSTIGLTANDPTMIKDGKVIDIVEDEESAPVIEGDVFMVPLSVLVDNAGAESDFVYNEQSVSIAHEAEETVNSWSIYFEKEANHEL